jgi:hypothetical protein
MLLVVLPKFERAVIGCFFTGSTNSVVNIRIYYRSKDSTDIKTLSNDILEMSDIDFKTVFTDLRRYFTENNDSFESYTLVLDNLASLSYNAKVRRERHIQITKPFLDSWKSEIF